MNRSIQKLSRRWAGIAAVGVFLGITTAASAANPAQAILGPNQSTALNPVKGSGASVKRVNSTFFVNGLGAGIDVTSVTNTATTYSTTMLVSCSGGGNGSPTVNGSFFAQNDNIFFCPFGQSGTAAQGGVLIL